MSKDVSGVVEEVCGTSFGVFPVVREIASILEVLILCCPNYAFPKNTINENSTYSTNSPH